MIADLLVRGAELLVTMSGDEIEGGWVAMTDGAVVAVGQSGSEPEARDSIDATGCLVTPGLVNVHHHMWQNLTRAFAPVVNADFLTWYRTLGDVWTRLDEESVYVSTWIALAELALGGCTATVDHLFVHPRPNLVDAQVKAARDVGVRLHVARGCVNRGRSAGGVLPDALAESSDAILADWARAVAAYHEPDPQAMVQVALAPTTTFDCTPDIYSDAALLAEKLDVRLHTHLAQVGDEDGFCRDTFGRGALDLFEDAGWGSPRSWVAHCIFVDPSDLTRIAGWGTAVAHCPSSNMLICEGIAPISEMRAAGTVVGIGCDGSASTDHASLWLEARTALLLGRLRRGPTAMSGRDVLEMATIGSAACIGRTGELGVVEPGACGDVVAWPLEGVRYAGALSDPVEAWIRCGPTTPRHTVVGGRPVVRDGELALPALDEMLRSHRAIARSWQTAAT